MTEGSVVTDCWGGLFYITPGLGLELGFDGPQGFPLSFHTELSVAMFLGSLSSFDLSLLSQRFNPQAKRDRTAIQRAIMRGRLHVFPMDASIALVSAVQNNARPNQSASAQSNFGASNTKQLSTYGSASNDLECVNRTVLVVRSDIRNVLQQIVQQERIESRQLEKSYQAKSALGKTGAHIQHFSKGLHEATGSFLTWLKDVNDVVSINQRLLRILMAAQAASHVESNSRYELFQKLVSEAEKKELVEALGFDPSLITVEKITEVYSLAKLIHDDQATQLIIAHFVENYIKAQHSLEWSEFSGGVSFEIILTALLAVVTGGVGAIASLGAQARKLSQMKKLGELFSELAELLKKVPKAKGLTMRKQKALEEKKERKKDARKPSQVVADIENTGTMPKLDGGPKPNKFSEIYSKAPAAKLEIDTMADEIADMFGGHVAKAPIKSQERALQKIMNEYGGEAARIKDLARNTIIVSPDKVDSVVAELAQRGAKVKVIDGATDPLGYSGVNSTIKTQAGIVGETQVNTPAMIYAKESEPMARALLGDNLYSSIATNSGMPGGQGHVLYEQWRVLPSSDPGRSALEAESKAYYNAVRGSVYGN
jgi:hypothetical protein